MATTTKGRKRVRFKLDTEPGREVCVAGSFNSWAEGKKKLTDKEGAGHYTATVLLPPGEYEYKFIVDGNWCVDPACRDWMPNAMGSLNSVLRVG